MAVIYQLPPFSALFNLCVESWKKVCFPKPFVFLPLLCSLKQDRASLKGEGKVEARL